MSGLRNRKATSSSTGATSGGTTTSTNPKKQPKDETKEQRRKQQQKQPQAASSKNAKQQQPPKEDTLSEVFKEHPMSVVAIVSFILYMLYKLYIFLLLKHPEYINQLGIATLRPAVRLQDERQFLILGGLGSGTDRVVDGLARILELEVGYELLDAESWFARDGSLSQFLAIRYTPFPSVDVVDHIQKVMNELCLIKVKVQGDVFNPAKQYRPYNNCSSLRDWSNCHAQECLRFLRDEWGCALREGAKCTKTTAPVRRTLYFVQHPVRMIQELMTKICPSTKTKTPHPAFKRITLPWLPMVTNETSCLGHVAWYVVNFNQQLVNAHTKGLLHSQIVKYDDVSLCDIAKIAGFDSEDTVVYPPNLIKYNKKCNSENQGDEDQAKLLLPDVSMGKDPAPKKVPTITWNDIRGAGGTELEGGLRKLCKDLSYDTVLLQQEEFEEETIAKGTTSKIEPKVEVY